MTKEKCSSLLKTTVTSYAADGLAQLSPVQISCYDLAKARVLKTYELVQEADKHNFRNLTKYNEQTYA